MSKKKKNKKAIQKTLHKTIEKKQNFTLLYFLFVLFVFSLYYNQWTTLEKLSNAINPIARFGTLSMFLQFLNKYGYRIFNGYDKFFFYLIIFIPIFILLWEGKTKIISKFINTLPKSHTYILFYLFIASLIFLRSYFARGQDMYTGDAPYFLLLTRLIKNSLLHFKLFPFWTFLYGGGAPFNQFYGPLHSYVSGFFALFFNIYVATKLTLFLFHFFSVVGIYLFIYELTNSKKSAFLSGLAGILLYHHIHVILFPGRYGIAAIWAIYPFLFYFLEKALKNKQWQNFVGISISISFMLFASLGMSFYFFLFWGVYVVFRLLFIEMSLKEKIIWSLYFFGSVIFGFLLSSYYIYSFLIEAKWSVQQTFDKFKIAGIGHNIFKQIFLWNNYQISLFKFKYAWQSSYFGLSLLLINLYVLVMIIKKNTKKYWAILFSLFVLLFYILGYGRIKLLTMIPYLHTYSQVRSFNILAFWIIFFTGIGYTFLSSHTKYKNMFLIFVVVIVGDLFFTTFHDTWGRQYGDYATPIFQNIKRHSDSIPPYRFDLFGSGISRSVHHNWRAFDAFIAESENPIIAETVWDYKPVRLFVNFCKQKWTKGNEINDAFLEKYYYLFNTKDILSTTTLTNSFFQLINRTKKVFFYKTITNSPIILTTKLTNVEFDTNKIFPFLHDIKVDYSTRTMNKMWITDGPSTNLEHPVKFEILKHEIKNNKVFLSIQSDNPSFAILSYSAYPTIKVYCNNKKIPFYQTVYGFIVIPLREGKNSITIVPGRTKGSFVALLLSSFLYLFIILGLIYRFKKRKEL